jgi:hypothetical protein
MAELTVTAAGSLDRNVTGAYAFGLFDLPGVALANNFASLFNPVGSGRIVDLTDLIWGKYVATTATTAASMVEYLITTATGGVDSSSLISPLSPSGITSVAVLRTSNPTVTLGNPLLSLAPPLSSGSFNNAQAAPVKASSIASGLLLLPGNGVVFRTASGDVNQRWNITLAWAELSIDSVETV